MPLSQEKYSSTTSPESPDFPNRYFCKLFDDMIVRELCLLRRRELSGKRQFTCTGCSKDRILQSLEHRRIMPFRT